MRWPSIFIRNYLENQLKLKRYDPDWYTGSIKIHQASWLSGEPKKHLLIWPNSFLTVPSTGGILRWYGVILSLKKERLPVISEEIKQTGNQWKFILQVNMVNMRSHTTGFW